jgi:transposase
MQEDSFRLQQGRLAALPIMQKFMTTLGVKELLTEAMGHEAHAEALETLVKSVLLRPDALYRLRAWTASFDDQLVRKNLSDDMLARALDRLHKADRASLLTKLSLTAISKFSIETSQVHNDSTSVKFSGEYAAQNPKAVQLKRGHSKDHRPDLKQLVYSLSVTRDGAIPIHFKAYDGNQTDDKTHWDLWQSLRGLLGRSDFLYVADSKLCVAEIMRKIDREQGSFVTILPRTRHEVAEFAKEAAASRVRWQSVHQQRVRKGKIDHFEAAEGLFQMREGYRIYWYRSSEKKVRDKQDRDGRIAVARGQLLQLNNAKRRGPKSETAMQKAIDKIIARYKIGDWLIATVSVEEVERFRQTRKGKATESSLFKRSFVKRVTVEVRDNIDSQNQSAAMDGIFPLVTNKDLSAVATLKAYKFQPRLEKRHSLFKSVLQVAPVFLKKNDRIEALMFVYFIAQMIAALIERKLRAEMQQAGIESLPLLPEGRPTKTPTTSHIIDTFRDCSRQYLFNDDRMIKTFAEPLSPDQIQVLKLLGVPASVYK